MGDRNTAFVLLGHGSRVAEANAGLSEVAEQVAALLGGVHVEVAFLQMAEPGLAAVLERCAGAGYRKIAVVPFFLFAGAHVRQDIPDIIESFSGRHPQVLVGVGGVLGGHPKLAEAAAERAREAAS